MSPCLNGQSTDLLQSFSAFSSSALAWIRQRLRLGNLNKFRYALFGMVTTALDLSLAIFETIEVQIALSCAYGGKRGLLLVSVSVMAQLNCQFYISPTNGGWRPNLRAQRIWVSEEPFELLLQLTVLNLRKLTNKSGATIDKIGSPTGIIQSIGPYITGILCTTSTWTFWICLDENNILHLPLKIGDTQPGRHTIWLWNRCDWIPLSILHRVFVLMLASQFAWQARSKYTD